MYLYARVFVRTSYAFHSAHVEFRADSVVMTKAGYSWYKMDITQAYLVKRKSGATYIQLNRKSVKP